MFSVFLSSAFPDNSSCLLLTGLLSAELFSALAAAARSGPGRLSATEARDGLCAGSCACGAASGERKLVILLTCGAYDAAGDFAYRIGLPVKTGVGGGIVAIVPGVGTVAVWGPELDAKGNSVLGAFALEQLVQRTGWSHD